MDPKEKSVPLDDEYDCAICGDTGLELDSGAYCEACALGTLRMRISKFADDLQKLPFKQAIWIAYRAAQKSERAIAAADKVLMQQRLQKLDMARSLAEARAFELSKQLDAVMQPVGFTKGEDA